jgi:NAD-dependent dihydropyrimidine dehydrogenase PreA subunit
LEAYLHSRIWKVAMQPDVPRETISWFPRIDFDTCIGDQECVNVCKKRPSLCGYELKNRPEVIRPLNCVVGCDACSQICRSEATHFPSKEELRRTMRGLIQGAHQTARKPGRLDERGRPSPGWGAHGERKCCTECSKPWLIQHGFEF